MSAVVTVLTSLLGGSIAGLVAAVAMDVPMSRQSDGWAPAVIAAAVLTRTTPEKVSLEQASVIHHVTGVAAGILYGVLTFAMIGVVPSVSWSGVPLLAHLLAVVGVTLFIYLFFSDVVFPRVGGTVYEERATAIRGQWLRSSLVFAVTLAVAGPPVIGGVATVVSVA